MCCQLLTRGRCGSSGKRPIRLNYLQLTMKMSPNNEGDDANGASYNTVFVHGRQVCTYLVWYFYENPNATFPTSIMSYGMACPMAIEETEIA